MGTSTGIATRHRSRELPPVQGYLLLGAIVAMYSLAIGVIVLLLTTAVAAVAGDAMRLPLQIGVGLAAVLAGGLGGTWLLVQKGLVGFGYR
jgi:hypothetical protein